MLEIRNLVKVYPGPVAALQGVSLEASRGMLGLLGPNGAGKTTLLRIVAGLLEPTSGAVLLDGEDVSGDPRRIRRHLGYLPQDFGFYPHLTGTAMLRFLLVLKGVSAPRGLKRLAAELLERVNLEDAAKRKVGTWSGGMRQRLGIAQALAGDPRIVVVDEPTAGLDPEERMRFYRLLAELGGGSPGAPFDPHRGGHLRPVSESGTLLTSGRDRGGHHPGAGARPPRRRSIFEGAVEKDRVWPISRRSVSETTQAVLIEGRNRVRDACGGRPAARRLRASHCRVSKTPTCSSRANRWIRERRATTRGGGTPSRLRDLVPPGGPPSARRELSSALRRPSYWFLFGILVLVAWGFSAGNVRISSGDATVGGDRAHITSVFAQSMFQSVLITAMGAWFLAIGAGLALIRDAEHRVGEVLHSTRLTAREYVWGSFAGAITAFLVIWGLYLGASAGFNHVLATGEDARHIGPFVSGNYLYPALLLGFPQIVFFAGVPFFLGAWTRRPIVVFAFPVAMLLVVLGFLVSWSPSWLDPAINRALMLVDPSGFRWLNETFLELDRGVDFYNTAPLPPDTGFLLSRIALAGVGLLAVEAAARNTARRLLRGDTDSVVIGFRRSSRKKSTVSGNAQTGHR